MRTRSVNPQMGVAPEDLFSTRFVDIPIADIDAANKSGFPVDHDDFAVVPIVQPIGQKQKDDFVKGERLYPYFPQSRYHLPANGTAAKIVINKTDLHTFLGFLD